MNDLKIIPLDSLVVSRETGIAEVAVEGIFDLNDPEVLSEISGGAGIDVNIYQCGANTSSCGGEGGIGGSGGEGS